MYEGTVRMLLEYGATMHEHMKLLEGSKLNISNMFNARFHILLNL